MVDIRPYLWPCNARLQLTPGNFAITPKELHGSGVQKIRNSDSYNLENVLNGAYEDTEETGRTLFGDIMHDFRCSEPGKMRCPAIRERAIFLKQREEGRKIMSKAIREAFKTELEEARAAVQAETRREIARNLIAQGLPYPAIAEGTGLSEDEVRAIAGEDDKSAA